MRRYAMVVNQEVFDIIEAPYNEYTSEALDRWSAGAAALATVIDATGLEGVSRGSIFSEGSFDNSEVEENLDSVTYPDLNTFCFVSNNRVFGLIVMSNTDPKIEMYKAALSEDVFFVEILDESLPVSLWWKWDGEAFTPPQAGEEL